jgi:hypothetical protein
VSVRSLSRLVQKKARFKLIFVSCYAFVLDSQWKIERIKWLKKPMTSRQHSRLRLKRMSEEQE